MKREASISALPTLVARVYEAAVTPELWDQVMERARHYVEEAIGADGRAACTLAGNPDQWWDAFANDPPNELVRQFLPYLDSAYKVRLETLRLRTAYEAGLAALDLIPFGIALLGDDRAAIFCNSAAQRVASQSNGLGMDPAKRFVATSPRDDAQLQQHIQTAIQYGRSGSRHAGVVKLSRRTSTTPLCVLVVAPGAAPRSGTRVASAILFISDPDTAPGAVREFLTAMHGLTPAEARMASALITGQTLAQYAMSRGITRNTARTQLRQVLAKTGAQRQADLMRIILTSPATIAFGCEVGA